MAKNYKVLVIGSNDLDKTIQNILNKEELHNKVDLYKRSTIKDIDNIEAQVIFLQDLDIEIVKNIRKSQKLKASQIILIIKDKHFLKECINLNIDDYLLIPYEENEVYLKLIRALNCIENKKRCCNMEMQFNALLNNTPYMAWFKDKDSNYIKVNDDFIVHSGKEEKDILGRDDYYVWNGTIGERCRQYDLEVMQNKKRTVFDEIIPGKKGIREFNIYKAPMFNEASEVIGTIGIARDITEDNENRKKIKTLAYFDYLTGTLNRRGLFQYIEKVIRKDKHIITLMFLDLDNFKKLNDSFGHYYGDNALVKITSKIKESNPSAKLARIGGDEFVIAFKELNSQKEIIESANKILNNVRMEFSKGDRTIIISGSIGIVQGDISYTSYEDLLLKGDAALYKAKERGKNQFVFYEKELEDEIKFNLQIEEDIKRAIEKKEIKLKYQPQFSVSGKLVGVEALFRWDNIKYKDIAVIDIIKTIEEFNIMDSIGDYILREAFIFAKKINEISEDIILVSVNISALQIMGNKFIYKFKNILNEVGVSAKYIGIEITETVLLENINENMKKIKEIQDLGISVAIDDFGTGYSSLNYLVKLPISKVKIDKTFITVMNDGDEYRRLVNLIIEIAHSLSLEVVVEGVEKPEQLITLKEMKADIFQGFLFSKPLTETEIIELVEF